MIRVWLRDDQFERIAALLPGKASDPGRTAAASTAFANPIGERERIALYRVRFIEGWLGFRSRFGYAHISGDVWSESCRLR